MKEPWDNLKEGKSIHIINILSSFNMNYWLIYPLETDMVLLVLMML